MARVRALILIITFLLALVLDLAGYLFWQASWSWVVLWLVGLCFALWLHQQKIWVGILALIVIISGLFYGQSTVVLLAVLAGLLIGSILPQLQRRVPKVISFCLGFLSVYALGWRVAGTEVLLSDLIGMCLILALWGILASRLFTQPTSGYAV